MTRAPTLTVLVVLTACGAHAPAATGPAQAYCARSADAHYCKPTLDECEQVAQQYASMNITMQCQPTATVYCWRYLEPGTAYGSEPHCAATLDECNQDAAATQAQYEGEDPSTRDVIMGGPPPAHSDCIPGTD